jgi:hypothetical protein
VGHAWAPGGGLAGPAVLYFEESHDELSSGGCERVCCKQNRHVAMYVREGSEHGNVVMQIHKSFGLAGCW